MADLDERYRLDRHSIARAKQYVFHFRDLVSRAGGNVFQYMMGATALAKKTNDKE